MCMRTIKQKVNYTERARSPNRRTRGRGWFESFYGSAGTSARKKKKCCFLSLLRAGDQNRVIKIQSHLGLLSEVGLLCLNKGRIGMSLMSSLKGDFKFFCLWRVMSVLEQEMGMGFCV